MTLRNTRETFGLVAKSFHWIMALIVLALLSVGFFMSEMDFSPQKLQLFMLHKSFGILVLVLVVLRLSWRWFISPPPDHLSNHAQWERVLAYFSHFLLYVALFLMPVSGWVMSSAGDFPNSFFGLFEMPDLVAKNEDIFKATREIHETLAWVIIGIVGLHVAGAFKHHIIDRDRTLQRMTTDRLGLFDGLLLAGAVGVLLALPVYFALEDDLAEYLSERATDARHFEGEAPPVPTEDAHDHNNPDHHRAAAEWDIVEEQSSIAFTFTQSGAPVEGRFEKFDGDIYFSPDNLAQSTAIIEIDIKSLKTGSAERDGQALSSDWFDEENYDEARFVAESFSHEGANRYMAQGKLTIRGVTLPLALPFTLDIVQNEQGTRTAVMKAEITLNRLDFGIGRGQWESAETIENPVKIAIQVTAEADGQ